MDNHNVLTGPQAQPFAQYGLTHSFWTINTETLISTVVVTCIIILFCFFARHALSKKKGVARFIILKYVDGLKDLIHQTLQSSPIEHLAFIGSLFTFILLCNTISLLPFLEEPTKDLNTTLALGLISFFYVQGHSIKHNGLYLYVEEYFEPFFLMFPLNLMGTLTSIISLSFRLFGNIFGGYIISSLYFKLLSGSVVLEILGLISGANVFILIIFGMFEGIIQAFVFSMLTLTYLSMEIASEEETEQA